MMDKMKSEIFALLKSAGVETQADLSVPPNPEMGDFAFPCFNLAKEQKKNPAEVALELKSKCKMQNAKIIDRVAAFGPYVNFFLNNGELAKLVIKEIQKKGEKYGENKIGKGQKVMIEYSQPNTHKEFHIGHLRNVCIGSTIVNLSKASGYKTISANYIGDIGAHVAKCLWYIKKYHEGDLPKDNKGKWLGQMYAAASQKIESDEKLKEEVAETQRKLEAGDKELIKFWQETKKWSMTGFEKIYNLLGVKFDEWFYESEVEKPGKEMVEELLKKGIAQKGEKDAIIVDLKPYGLETFLILKGDGSSLYATKDLALADYKFNKFKIDRSIYIVDNRQKFYFTQLFKTLELMGWKKDTVFLGYDFVTLPDGAMAARKGNAVLLDDVYNDVYETTFTETKSRHVEWTENMNADAARKISLAAIKFDILKHPVDKVIVFNKKEALDFNGFTGPYVLYVVARINSIIRKSKIKNQKSKIDFELLKAPSEKKLLLAMAGYEDVVRKALENYNPSVIAKYSFDLAQAFNEFYNAERVLNAESEELITARVALCGAVKNVLENALEILSIEVVEEM